MLLHRLSTIKLLDFLFTTIDPIHRAMRAHDIDQTLPMINIYVSNRDIQVVLNHDENVYQEQNKEEN
jgi:peptide methionine sulfoxide reductase MsrA